MSRFEKRSGLGPLSLGRDVGGGLRCIDRALVADLITNRSSALFQRIRSMGDRVKPSSIVASLIGWVPCMGDWQMGHRSLWAKAAFDTTLKLLGSADEVLNAAWLVANASVCAAAVTVGAAKVIHVAHHRCGRRRGEEVRQDRRESAAQV